MFSFASSRRRAGDASVASRRTAAVTRLAVEALEDRTVPGFLAPIASPGGGDSLTLADVNHDRFADAVVISTTKSVSVSLGHGDGTFGTQAKLGGASGKLYYVFVSDFNADGNPDIVALGRGNDLVSYRYGPPGEYTTYYVGTMYTNVWLGDGHGAFSPAQTTSSYGAFGFIGPFTYNPTFARGDFNNDAIPDSAFINSQTGTVSLLLGNGDGTFQSAQIYAAGPSPGSIAVGDVNGDGWTDLVVVNNLDSGNSTFSVLLNDGSR